MIRDPDPRDALLRLFAAALERVGGAEAVRQHLQRHPFSGSVHVVAIGKAASAMARGAEVALGERLERGLIITKHGHADEPHGTDRFQVVESDHPVPGAATLRAGRTLLDFIAATPANGRFLFLISGGASSLVEVLPEGLGLAELQRLTRWLLASGLDIEAMNRVRKAVSLIKGGRLLHFLDRRPTRCLLISDVPGDDPAVIGSGLVVREPPAPLPPGLPDWVDDWIAEAGATRMTGEAAPIELAVVATLDHAKEAAAEAARGLGLDVRIHDEFISGDPIDVARQIVHALTHSHPGVHIWGGETTPLLPPEPGRGGRNQQLALAAAVELAGRRDAWLLAAGTDGTDGPTEDAGAVIDGGTVERGRGEGLDPRDCLERADAGRFLEASGDLLQTGPTGTNVMDLVIALVRPDIEE